VVPFNNEPAICNLAHGASPARKAGARLRSDFAVAVSAEHLMAAK
jgi:hypothetical protein